MPGPVRTSAPLLQDLSADEAKVIRAVLVALRSMRFGHVGLTVQDGKVIQMDRLEKERF